MGRGRTRVTGKKESGAIRKKRDSELERGVRREEGGGRRVEREGEMN